MATPEVGFTQVSEAQRMKGHEPDRLRICFGPLKGGARFLEPISLKIGVPNEGLNCVSH